MEDQQMHDSQEDSPKADVEHHTLGKATVIEGNKVRLDLASVNQFLTCPLCEGYYRDVYTISECLHSFCKSCIFRYFRKDLDTENEECPICKIELRKPLLMLRQDRTLQSIVDTLVPEAVERDAALEVEFYSSRGLPMPGAQKAQEESQARKIPSVARILKDYYDDAVKFKLAPERSSNPPPSLHGPFVHTSGAVSVGLLKRFLLKELPTWVSKVEEVEILYGGNVLGHEHTLQYIFKTQGITSEMPVFHYRQRFFEDSVR